MNESTRLIASFDIGTINLACCIIDNNEKIHYWNVFDISAPTNPLRCKRMVTQFDKVELFKSVEIVLVEFQPSCNPKARIIEGFVSTYFMIRSIDNNLNIKVMVYSPIHKLNCFHGECPDFTYLKSEYTRRKKLSIFHTQEIIKSGIQDEEFVETFQKSKKKDDLSDSFLQAISYIRYKCEHKEIVSRKPALKQKSIRKYNKANLKYIIIDELQKNETRTSNGVNINNFLENWITNGDGILKNIVLLYEHDYNLEIIKKELIPESYFTSMFNLPVYPTKITKKIKKIKKKQIDETFIDENTL
jgi:hypothetical protein